jgi:hypothetical protein
MSPLGFLKELESGVELETATQDQINDAFTTVLDDPVKWSYF